MTWAEHAACAGHDTAVFFPVATDPAAFAPALAICATCPVEAECLADAVAKGEMDGVRGGLTPDERRRLHGGATRVCAECGERFLLRGAPRRVCGDGVLRGPQATPDGRSLQPRPGRARQRRRPPAGGGAVTALFDRVTVRTKAGFVTTITVGTGEPPVRS